MINNNCCYNPSFPRKIWNTVTSPRVLISCGAGGVASAIAGCTFPVSAAVAGTAYGIQLIFKKIIIGGETLRPAAFISCDYLIEMQGGTLDITLPPVLQVLKRMNTPHSIQTMHYLENCLAYVQNFSYSGFGNGALVSAQQKLAASLQPGEQMSLPCSYFAPTVGIAHIMIASIQRKENQLFLVKVSNAGDGSYFRHHRKQDMVQTVLEIDDVQPKKVHAFISALASLHAVRVNNSTEKLYAEILHNLNGKILPPSHDPRYWKKSQWGNSCSGYTVGCFVKAHLPSPEYVQFKTMFLSNCAKRLFAGLRSSWRFWEKTQCHAVVFKEVQIQLLKYQQVPPVHLRAFLTDASRAKESQLSRISARVMTKFWDCIFDPKTLWRGKTTPDKHFGRNIQKVKFYITLMTHPEMRKFYKEYPLSLLRNGVIYENEKEKIKAIIEGIFKEFSSGDFPEQANLTKAYQLFKKETAAHKSSEKDHYESRGLRKFLALICPAAGISPQKTPVAVELLDAIAAFKNMDYDKSREHLIRAYKNVPLGMYIEDVRGCLHVLEQLIPFFRESSISTVTTSIRLEEIEFHIAICCIFKKIELDQTLPSSTRFTIEYEMHPYLSWENEFRIYSKCGLHRYLPAAPWIQDMVEFQQKFRSDMLEMSAQTPIIAQPLKPKSD